MIDKKGYDYDDVTVVVDGRYASYGEDGDVEPDLSFKLGNLTASIPVVLYYDSPEGDSSMEKACEENGIITAGAMGSKIALPMNSIQKSVYGPEDQGFKLFEAFAPLSLENRKALGEMRLAGHSPVVGVSVTAEHARAVVNELRLAAAVLVGPTQAQTTRRLEATGITVPRVSLLEEICMTVDAPVIATASSPADVCKALVAGADAVLIHFGGPFELGDDLAFAVKSVADSLRENLAELCRACGAKNVRALSTRCKLTPR